MVSECGYLMAQVNVMKDTGATLLQRVNSGFNHLIRPMMYDAYHQIENISNPAGKKRFIQYRQYLRDRYICCGQETE